ncbi:MAG: hydrogenase expression/formation protein HypE [Bacteroidetes bacterium]|nr:hydrogenase expression/formation protein HypE [Bacteroidota bacterium]MCW5896172.1 hydrogenase expression/formation protein HypE [Bacteroidota bacterium]
MSCPIPLTEYKHVLLAHGSGGKLTHQLIQKVFLSQFKNEALEPLHDGAILNINGSRLAFSTDSFVVNPIVFPGGSIGELAVNGTVNDLAVCGAKPLFIGVGFIIEEGFSMEELWRIAVAMQEAARKAGVMVVTGDTKVVERGKADKIFINTSGIGVVEEGVDISPKNIKPGDAIIVSGTIADHGIAIMSVREGLEFETQITSDTAPLNDLVERMFSASKRIRVLRDATRGGVASVLNELAESSGIGLTIVEERIPLKEEVRGACELLGFDPLYVANEGKLLAIVPKEVAEAVLEAMRSHPLGVDAQIIGEATMDHPRIVVMKSRIGGTRVVDMLSGEQLPRIC